MSAQGGAKSLARLGLWLLGAAVAGCCLAVVAVVTWWWPIPLILALFFAYIATELARFDAIPPLVVGGLFLAAEAASIYAAAAVFGWSS